MPGASRRIAASAVGNATAPMPSGAPIVNLRVERRRVERIGASDHVPRLREHEADLLGERFGARRRDHALRMLQEQRIVEQTAQPPEPVADRRRRQLQPLSGAADVALLEDGLEHHEQVQVHAREINFIQHIAEIISLDSVS